MSAYAVNGPKVVSPPAVPLVDACAVIVALVNDPPVTPDPPAPIEYETIDESDDAETHPISLPPPYPPLAVTVVLSIDLPAPPPPPPETSLRYAIFALDGFATVLTPEEIVALLINENPLAAAENTAPPDPSAVSTVADAAAPDPIFAVVTDWAIS